MTVAAPPKGNAIVPNPLPWHSLLVGAFVVGTGIWLVERYAGDRAGIILTGLILLGVLYKTPGFSAELNSLLTGAMN